MRRPCPERSTDTRGREASQGCSVEGVHALRWRPQGVPRAVRRASPQLRSLTALRSKSAASRTAIDQRQAHGVLQQDQKTRHDKLATTTDKLGVAQRKLDKLTDAEATATALQETVRSPSQRNLADHEQTKSEFTARSKDLLDAKKELSSREAVQTQTACVFGARTGMC